MVQAASRAPQRIRGLNPQQRLEERREQLLSTALELFGTAGYSATSVERLCQSAYVSTRSFYELFANKEACYLALHRRLQEEIIARLVAAGESSTDAEVGPRMVEAFVRAMTDDIRVLRVASIESACISPAVDQRRREARHQGAMLVEATWNRLGLHPRHGSSRRLALGVIGAFFDILIDWYLDPSPEDVETLISDMVALLELLHAGMRASS
jgi:AcrR family transcriptional regulator